MQRKVVLLDFDGVVLKNHPIHRTVGMKCRTYLQKYVPIRDPIKASELNRHLYESTGHTLTGLKELGYPVSINEFNNYVYDNIDYSQLKDLKQTNKSDIDDFRKLKHWCKTNEIKSYIFSNAPWQWCDTILKRMGENDIDVLNTFCLLKPNGKLYDAVEHLFPDHKFYFIDDKMSNLVPVMPRKNWIKILMSYDKQDSHIRINEDTYIISYLNDCIEIIQHN